MFDLGGKDGAGDRCLGRHRRRDRPRPARPGLRPSRLSGHAGRGAGPAGPTRSATAVTLVPGDLADARGPPTGCSRTPRRRSAIVDVLVNNAGLTRDMLAMRMRDEDWQTVLDVNLHRRLPPGAGPACAA